MIDVKIIKKPRDGQATSGGSWGPGVKEAAHAARADVADLAMEARHAKESDHAVSSDEAAHAIEADHAKEADNAAQWARHEFGNYMDQPVRTGDGVTFESLILRGFMASPDFVDGFEGFGHKLWIDGGLSCLTLDRLTVRQTMSIFELLINKVRSVGGQICVSAANGKIKAVEEVGEDYVISFEQENTFAAHDLMRCQTFTGGGLKSYWVEVSSATGDTVIVAKSEFASSVPEVGDECVLMGNTVNQKRQNLALIAATEDGMPRIDVWGGREGQKLLRSSASASGQSGWNHRQLVPLGEAASWQRTVLRQRLLERHVPAGDGRGREDTLRGD